MKNIPLALRQAKNMFGQDSPWLPLLVLTLPAPDNTIFRILPNNEDVVFPAKVASGNATFARTGTAWSPSTGASVATGVPRFEPTGVMVEEASTNLCTYSNTFSNAAWTKGNLGSGSVAPAFPDGHANKVDPFGGTTATRVVFNAGGTPSGSQYSILYNICAAAAAVAATLSVWLRSSTGANQTVAILRSGSSYTLVTVTPTWQRFSFTSSASLAQKLLQIGAFTGTPQNIDIEIYQGNYVDALYSTSAIPTTTTTVTRNAESISFPTTSVLNASEGTISFVANPTKSGRIFQSTVDANNYFLIADNNVYIVVGGVAVANLTGVASLNATNRFTFTWGSTGKKFYKNAVVNESSANTTNMPFAATIAPNNVYPFNGTLGEVVFYNRCLSDTEVASVVSGSKPKDFSAYYPLTTALTKYIPGDTYTAFPVQIELPNETSKGEIPSITLQVSNVTRVLQGHLEALNGGVGATVKLIIINTAHLDEDYAELTMDFEVLSATCNNMWVSLKCGASNPLRRRFPLDKFFASHCSWQFKSVECAYGGADITCDRNITACRAKNNAHRFGGFPGLEPGGLRLA